jgi:hypothetical protein
MEIDTMEAPITLLISITSALGFFSLALGFFVFGKPGTYSIKRNQYAPRQQTTSRK